MAACTLSAYVYNQIGAKIDSGATLGNTIVAGNILTFTSGPDAYGTFTSHHGNLIGETVGSTGWVSTDLTGTLAHPLNPELAPLGNYGGPTQTMALLTTSPAINAGSVALVPSGVTTDQRGTGYPRIVNGTVDIGAFEGTGIPTTTAVQTSAASSTYGVSVTFTATVSDSSSGVPTGSVAFYDGSTDLGSGSSLSGSGNSATSMLTTSMVAAGTNLSIRAVYTPTGNFVGGSGSVSQTVNKATLTITAVGGFKAYGVSMPFVSTAFNETGLVTANGDTITGVTETSNGAKASATVTSPGPTYAVVPSAATGTGLSNYNITYVSGTLTVIAAATSTTVASSLNPSTVGQYVTFTATVSNTSGTSPMPAGTVQFSLDGTNFGMPVTLSGNGTASITQSLHVGTHMVTADFTASTTNFSASTGTLSGGQVVNQQIHTFIVTNVYDSGPGSLRDAIANANADMSAPPGGDTIGFAPSLAGGTINLTSVGDSIDYGSSALAITAPMIIDGSSAPGLTIAGPGTTGTSAFRIFFVGVPAHGVILTLKNVTVSGGDASGSGRYGGGGGLFDAGGTTYLSGVTISGNSAQGYGGGVFNYLRTTELTNCILTGNSATSGGGVMT